ncbi:MAG: hypothetical protein Q8K87_07530 [Hydrogenophaga sp.]|nr:hypothetical protein [Hydrogenophaga sp.]
MKLLTLVGCLCAADKHVELDIYPQNYTISNGYLEKILKMTKNDPARKALVWENLFYYSKKRRRVTYRTFSSSEAPQMNEDGPILTGSKLKNMHF